MAGENPDEGPTGSPDEFQSKTVWQRAKIAFTGPLTNIVLAFLVMPIVFLIGTEVAGPAKVGYVDKDTPAQKAGFQRGDVIERINGRRIDDWKKAWMFIAVNAETEVPVEIDRNGKKMSLSLRPTSDGEFKIGISGLLPDMPAQIVNIKKDSPADKAGFKPGDKIISVNGKRVDHYDQFSQFINSEAGRPLKIIVERQGTSVATVVTPIKDNDKFVIGVEIRPIIKLVFRKFGLRESIERGFSANISSIDLTFVVLKKLFALKMSIKNVGGPVMIAQLSGEAAKGGLSKFIEFLALISISLGVLNLFPIPILDGGLLLFLLIEAIRKKPLSKKTMEVSQSIGAAFLITFVAIVSYNDVMRWFFSK